MPPKSDGILESSLYVSDVPRSAARWRTLHAQIKPVLWPTSTTEEVLSGVNLRDKRILVTRVSAGLGAETARSLAAHGAQVAGAARESSFRAFGRMSFPSFGRGLSLEVFGFLGL